MSTNDHLEDRQREVQRKLGRNLLRLQQIELLIKAFVTDQHIAGPIKELSELKKQRSESYSRKTLGQIVGEFIGATVTPKPLEAEATEDPVLAVPDNVAWASISCRIEVTDEQFLDTKRRLEELVDLRNELVHHFLENHDLRSEEGCANAEAYLDDCGRQIDAERASLRGFADSFIQMRTEVHKVLQSPEFKQALLGQTTEQREAFSWETSQIVMSLREAEGIHAQGGWTPLDKGIQHAQEQAPEHTPTRYNCRSWRQVLHESQVFDIRREQEGAGKPTVTWYRSKAS